MDVDKWDAGELRDILLRHGFAPCDSPACMCGSWHHRYGLAQRMEEICKELRDADVLNNSTGNKPLNAIRELRRQRDEALADYAALQARIAELETDNERLRGAFDDADEQASVHWYGEWVEMKRKLAAAEARNAASERVASIAAEMREAVDAIQAPYEWIAPSSVYAWADELDAAIDAHAQGQAGEGKDG